MPTSMGSASGAGSGDPNAFGFFWSRKVTWLNSRATMRSEYVRTLSQTICQEQFVRLVYCSQVWRKLAVQSISGRMAVPNSPNSWDLFGAILNGLDNKMPRMRGESRATRAPRLEASKP